MFTGLIEEVTEVLERTDHNLVIGRPPSFDDIHIGSSIAVSGACLTVSSIDDDAVGFDVHAETWSRTKLGSLRKGDPVNLERALKVGDRFEGHIVQGHVDCVALVTRQSIPVEPLLPFLTIQYPPSLRHLIVEKGSIAVDGVSLTVVSVDDQIFSVALIPETLKRTTLGILKEGDTVNLETDIMGKYACA
ncbi:MAG TPA: riboflavin synthase [Candidatus Peribacterales bacterium]|nr:riboflavin synthase [Candidatus Peribacterales bacterium]